MKMIFFALLVLQFISKLYAANSPVKPFRSASGGWDRLLFAKKERVGKSRFGNFLKKAGALVKSALGLDALDKLKEQRTRLVGQMNIIDRNLILLRSDTRRMLRDAINRIETDVESSFLDLQVGLNAKLQQVAKYAESFSKSTKSDN